MTSREPTLASLHDSLLLDLDGVVYKGPNQVPNAVESLNVVTDLGLRLTYVTNNASRPPQAVVDQLVSLGLDARPEQVMTSAQAGARLVAEQVTRGGRVLAVGGPGVAQALLDVGLEPVVADGTDGPVEGDDVQAVLQGFGRDVNWRSLARATRAIHDGATWVATNTDMTIPIQHGIAPGNGTLVLAVRTATGVEPEVVGKPYPPLLLGAAERMGGLRPLVVGDRLDTDILGANNAKMPSLLVLTGVSGALDLWRAPNESRPTYLGRDLGALLQSPLEASVSGDVSRCRESVARLAAGRLEIHGGGRVEGIWAAAHLIWSTGVLPDNAVEMARDLMRSEPSPNG